MNLKLKITLRARLLGLIILPILSLFVFFGLSYKTISKLNQNLDTAVSVKVPLIEQSGKMRHALDSIFQNILLIASEDVDSLSIAETTHLKKSLEEYTAAAGRYLALNRSKTESEKYKAVEENWEMIKEILQVITDSSSKLNWTQKEDKVTFQNRIKGVVAPLSGSLTAIIESLDNMDTLRESEIQAWATESKLQTENETKRSMALEALVGLVILGLGFWTVQRTHKSLSQITENITATGAGLKSISGEMQSCGNRLLTETESSSREIKDTVNFLNQIKATVEKSKQTSIRAQELSVDALNAAEYGDMKTTDLLAVMQILSESSTKIQDITTVIDDIAFQINLLALNASVEAARAGEQGRGFAVVAEAVRTLAAKSAEASQAINRLIQEAVGNINMSLELTQGNQQSLQDILKAITELGSAIEVIKNSSLEQVSQINDIDQSLDKIDKSSLQNTTTAQQLTETADDQINQSMNLEYAADVLQTMVKKAA